MEYAIETVNLVKQYGEQIAVNQLNLHVPKGKVYGFLGRNGSGKTTTIRMIMGLIQPNQGIVRIFGDDFSKDRKNLIRKIGAIVETPGAYDNLTAIENLEITAQMFHVPKHRIMTVLELVGLEQTGLKKVGKFSLGMRQRLGIANALLHSPGIIILDEPTNGLDPEGIIEMRGIIHNLTQNEGISVMVSSHLLSEIEQIADYVGIIHDGSLIREAKLNELGADEQHYVRIETNCMEKTSMILGAMRLNFEYERGGIHVFCPKEMNQYINKKLVEHKISVSSLSSVSKTLEEKFLSVTHSKECMEVE